MTRHILILVENLPSPFDRRVWQEATTLHEAGYSVSIICPTGKGFERRRETIEGVEIWRYRLPVEAAGVLGYALEYGVALWQSITLALRVNRRRRVDVVQACNPPDILFVVGLLFKAFGRRRFVFDHHDLGPELYEAKFGRRDLLHRLMLLLERWTFRVADMSIATNESYRRIAVERGRMAPERVFVVRSGPSLERMQIRPPDPACRHGRPFLVGYLGVIGPQEGLDYLLEAARRIVFDLKRTDVHFGIVGGGTSLEGLRQRAAALGLGDHVTFTGRVPDDEMLAMLNTADICVNSDVYNAMNDKSTMNKVMEYMALGKPIVQFDLTEGRYSAGAASLYAARNDARDLADKIVELLDDPARRTAMGEFGRRRIETALEWRHEAPKLLAAYATLFPAPVSAAGSTPRDEAGADILAGGGHDHRAASSMQGAGASPVSVGVGNRQPPVVPVAARGSWRRARRHAQEHRTRRSAQPEAEAMQHFQRLAGAQEPE